MMVVVARMDSASTATTETVYFSIAVIFIIIDRGGAPRTTDK